MSKTRDVWQRLRRAAGKYLRGHDLGLTFTGEVYLAWLLASAARTITREGKAGDEDALREAEAAVRQLLETAAGFAGAEVTVTEPLGLYFAPIPLATGARVWAPRISMAHLRAALRKLCPIWPLCKRAKVATA